MTGSAVGSNEVLGRWGEPVDSRSQAIVRAMGDLQGDLSGLATDIRRGPIAEFHRGAKGYLDRLRREFLRHHRRLVVRAREDETADARREYLRAELAELLERFRAIVLSRASFVARDAWSPAAMLAGLERMTASLPIVVHAPFEERTYAAQPEDGLFRALIRTFLRFDRWLRRRISESPPKRRIELAELARFQVVGTVLEDIEGVAALFVEADAQLAGQSRIVLDGVIRGYEALVDAAEVGGDPRETLDQFRRSIEEDFALTDEHVLSVLNDGALRAEKLLQEGLRRMKADLPVVSTFELPARRRRSFRRLAGKEDVLEHLEERVTELRDALGSSYVLMALHLELRAFRAKVMLGFESRLRELMQDVRGRSVTQVERLEGGVRQALEALMEGEGAPSTEERTLLETLERTVSDAAGTAHQLRDQLDPEPLAAPFLEILNREALLLTGRYRVPVEEIARAEFKLPVAPERADVGFSEIVSTFVQRDIAPRLLDLLGGARNRLEELLTALDHLERIVTFETDASREAPEFSHDEDPPEGSTRVVLTEGLKRSHQSLEAIRQAIEPWPEELAESMRSLVGGRLEALREDLSVGTIADQPAGRALVGPGIGARVGRLTRILNDIGEESTRRVRQLVGEERIREFSRQLNLTTTETAVADPGALLAPPGLQVELPVYYRRLFAPHAHWAGDLLPGQEELVSRVLDDLAARSGVGLRTAGVLSSDGSGRSPLFTKVIRRYRGSVKRWGLTSPVTVSRLEELCSELGSGHLVLVDGFSFLFSARPGGFEPLLAFLKRVTDGAGRNAYLIESSDLSWHFAASVAPLASVFTAVRTAPLRPRELEQAVYARHKLSGWEVLVREDSVRSKRPEDQQRFFDRLHERAFGSLSLALRLWLAAVEEVDESRRRVVLGDLPPSPLPAFSSLEDDGWMTLYLTQRQGWMDAESLAAMLLVGTTEAVGRLLVLTRRGFLEREAGGVFIVPRHLRPVVLTVLRDRGWVS